MRLPEVSTGRSHPPGLSPRAKAFAGSHSFLELVAAQPTCRALCIAIALQSKYSEALDMYYTTVQEYCMPSHQSYHMCTYPASFLHVHNLLHVHRFLHSPEEFNSEVMLGKLLAVSAQHMYFEQHYDACYSYIFDAFQ